MAKVKWPIEAEKAMVKLPNGWWQFRCLACREVFNARTKSGLMSKIRAHARKTGYAHKLF